MPKVTEPNPYTKDKVVGYLLNDIDFHKDIFIYQKGYSINSEIQDKDDIYDFVNNISKTPYIINSELLNYITSYNNQNLLLDPNIKHNYENTKRNKQQENEYTYLDRNKKANQIIKLNA